MKNNSGFSLVELIVVIAIMAILAGVAVPTYSRYIEKANDASVNAELDEIKTAAFAACAQEGKTPSTITITIDSTSKKATKVETDITIDSDKIDTDEINSFLDSSNAVTTLDFSKSSYSAKTTLTWTSSTQKWQ